MKLTFVLLLIVACQLSVAQGIVRKTYTTKRTSEKIVLDGKLDETIWNNLPIATGFKQIAPIAGADMKRKTEVKLTYDDKAIYVGAIMYDDKDSISTFLSERDNDWIADYFVVAIDCDNKGLQGYAFSVTSTGVQTDLVDTGEEEERAWNAVWYSKVKLNEDHWVVEIKIPYSALRFPKQVIQEWGINFGRQMIRYPQVGLWNEYDPTGLGLMAQLGKLEGVKDIEAPLRLSISPYLSGYVEKYQNQTGTTFNGGADLKWGINEAFTVDATLVPDFGQVQFDQQVLNLSPFEVRFNENRQFFTEGTQLFNRGELFYSRRIGGSTLNPDAVYDELNTDDEIVSNPQNASLINATKLSGRTKKGTGIGVFNGLTRNTFAIISDSTGNERKVEVDPFTNYNVFVVDQALKNNSSVSLVNTNVTRRGHYYDANVTGAYFDIYTDEQAYNIYGGASVSQLFSSGSADLGHNYYVGFSKSSGNFQADISYDETSNNYDINDLGFLENNNERYFEMELSYQNFEPFSIFYQTWANIGADYTMLYKPTTFTTLNLQGAVGAIFNNLHTLRLWTFVNPGSSYDYFETRTPNRYYLRSKGISLNAGYETNFNKPVVLAAQLGYVKRQEEGRRVYSYTIGPKIRLSPKMNVLLSNSYFIAKNDEGAALDYNFDIISDNDDPIFGRRDWQTIENSIGFNYIFNNKMGLTTNVRHYWSKVKYHSYHALEDNGTLGTTTYLGEDGSGNSFHNNSFNAFTVDLVYKWVFAPGSELSLVWKNSIFNFNDKVDLTYIQNTRELFNVDATNSLSLKVLFYLDYGMLKK